MARIALLFLAGMAVLHGLPMLPSALLACLLSFFVPVLCRKRECHWLLAVLAGFAWAWMHASHRVNDRLDPAYDGERVTISGCIVSLPQKRDYGWRFDFAQRDPRLPRRLRLSLYQKDFQPAPGDCWQLTAKLKAPRGSHNPGVGSYETRLFRDGIGATGYVVSHAQNRRLESKVCCFLTRMRGRLVTAIETHTGTGMTDLSGAIIRGLAVGDRSRLSVDQRNVFAATGTGHLMAISGLHIGLAMWLGRIPGYLVWWLWLYRRGVWPRQTVVLLSGFASAMCYAALSGFAIPTRRALVMLLVYIIARLSKRNVSPVCGLVLAAFFVNVLDPFALLAPGFWMSFCAVAAILLGARGTSGRARQFAAVQFSIFIGLMPVSALVFGKLIVASPIVNAIAVPYASLVVIPAALLGSIATAVSNQVGGLVLVFCAKTIDFAWPMLEWFARFPYVAPASTSIAVLLAMLLMTAILLLRQDRFAFWLLLPLSAVIMLADAANIPEDEVRLDLLDVGQGLAIVVRTRRHALVYDTGPAWRGGFDSGSLIVAPFLNHLGYTRADTLIISHSDLDHSGGAASLAKKIRFGRVLAGDMQGYTVNQPALTGAEPCHSGQHWIWDGVRFEVLHPESGTAFGSETGDESGFLSGNNSSCVIRISIGRHAILLPGDIESGAEQRLMTNGKPLAAGIVIVPHHGSSTSSTPSFVRATAARYALVAAAWNNRWGFPKDAVVQRWSKLGAAVLTTARYGCLSLAMDSDGIRFGPVGYRQARRHYWLPIDVNH